MPVTAPVRKDVQHPRQIKKHSAALRFWHWANTIIISGSLITVLINSTLTDKHKTAAFMQSKFQKTGATVSAAQARSVANALSDTVWDVHKYFGFCLAGLLLFRLILEFFQLADQKFTRKMKGAYTYFNTIKKNRQMALHELTVKIIYALFYCLLTIMVVTGLSLAFDDDIPALKPLHHSVKSVHGFCMYLVLAFIAVHLIGVFIAERKQGKGIVSDMINGGDNLK